MCELNLISHPSLTSLKQRQFLQILSLSCNNPTQSQEEHLEALRD